MACPALPTCGLAVAESERFSPTLIAALEELGYGDEQVEIRIAGCPNACSRPPTAEVGVIGRSLGLYNLYVGGSLAGTRLARLYQADVHGEGLAPVLGGLIDRWREGRVDGEAFGDWANRTLDLR